MDELTFMYLMGATTGFVAGAAYVYVQDWWRDRKKARTDQS